MLADAARIDDLDIGSDGDEEVVTKELKTAEDVEKFINSMM